MKSALSGVLASLVLAGTAHAVPVRFEYTARLNLLNDWVTVGNDSWAVAHDRLTVRGKELALGSTVTGFLTYDSASPPEPGGGSDPAIAYYQGVNSAMSALFEQSGLRFDARDTLQPALEAIIMNSAPGAGSDLAWLDGRNASDETDERVSISLGDDSGAAFGNAGLPSSLDRSRFNSAGFRYTYSDYATGQLIDIYGDLSSFRQVPEPGTMTIALSGLVMLGLARRRRKGATCPPVSA